MSEFDQSNLDLSTETPSGPVECLGQTFESDDARREHYIELLREKLKDPEFRKIEGFPIGEDEDILALSDPPYYTACPNPWIEDFVKHHGRPYDPDEKYHREPFAADVSDGKNHPIYNAHSYHTKVPHRSIMRYILHYTDPGDLVFDGFCGTGMTGVAAQLCGDKSEVQELGYRVDQSGIIYNAEGESISKLGPRRALLNDLSPAATFIAYNYNVSVDVEAFECEAVRTLSEVQEEFGWLYETTHTDGRIGRIAYVIWSDVFMCPQCGCELVFWEVALNESKEKVLNEFFCNSCNAKLNKKNLDTVWSTEFDRTLKESRKLAKQVPVSISYDVAGQRFSKAPEKDDYNRISEAFNFGKNLDIPYNKLPPGNNTVQPFNSHGVEYVADFYTSRNAIITSAIRAKGGPGFWKAFATALVNSKMNRWPRQRGPLNGTLYIGAVRYENNVLKVAANKKFPRSFVGGNIIQVISSSSTYLPSNSLDYLFLDPPFGANINYSELNFIWESWIKIYTNIKEEAIQNSVQNKSLQDYRTLMSLCFSEAFRILKPGRWMTVEFSNTNSSVWNSIQTALTQCGFIVANVSALDKKQGSFKAVTTTTAVKQDLVISAYKPSKQLELIFSEKGDSVEGVWQFIDSHLKQLPVSKPKGGSLEFVAERDPRILYDRMVAFYIGHNTPVPLSSGEFQAALDDKYPARDGMVFLPEQVAQYDKLAAKMESVGQMVVFVEDEKSAIGWLRQYLKDKPSTYQGIHPDFTQQLSASWRKFETRPELSVLLDQNFLKYSGDGDVPSQIHGYLSTDYHDLRKLEKDDPKLKAKAKDRWYVPDPKKMADVEAQREKKLLAEFWEYAAQAGVERGQTQTSQASLQLGDSSKKKPKVKKLKEVRTDAVRAGFMECQRNNQGSVILAVAEILPANVIEEDEQLQMIYDMAEMRAG